MLIVVFQSVELEAAFARHQEVFSKLDICINNAGIVGGPEPFYENDTWRKVIEIDMVALIDATSKAVPYPTPSPLMIILTNFYYNIYTSPWLHSIGANWYHMSTILL